MTTASEFPRRRVMALWSLLGLALIAGFYALVLLCAVACVYVPLSFLIPMKVNESDPTTTVMVPVFFLIGVLVAGILVWAVLPRRKKFTAPGPLLERASHPMLFGELDGIAAALKERPPAEVYLTTDVNAWVTHRGGILGLGGRRVLAVGLPLLSILSVSQLRAVLAHELGHYYGGDARLGPLLYRTRVAMVRTQENLSSVEFVTFFIVVKLVWLALRKALVAYVEFFLLTTSRISQRQELRADELACWIADSRALIEGLKRIHAAPGAFLKFWEQELSPIIAAGYRPPIAAGFALYLEAPEVASRCQKILEEALWQLPATPGLLSIGTVSSGYDSHPPLSDRIRHASTMPDRAGKQQEEPATTLLGDVGAAELLLLQSLNPDLRNADLLKSVSWQEVAELVLIPSWRKTVARVSPSLAHLTAQALPDATDRLRDIGRQMPDPKGMLLTADQRAERAGEVLEMALGLALLNNGWQFHVAPGQYSFRRGSRSLSTIRLMEKMRSGEIAREDWVAQCQALGIAQVSLGTADATERAAI